MESLISLPSNIVRILSWHISKGMPELLKKFTEKYGLSDGHEENSRLSFESFIISDIQAHSIFKTLRIQTCWRMKRISKRFKLRQKKLRHRGYVIRELVDSEEKFYRSLESVVQKVQIPCENARMINKDEIHVVFSCLKNIMLLSKEISGRLQARMKDFDVKKTLIVNVFLECFEFYKIFSPYCNNFPDAQNFIVSTRKEKERPFAELLRQTEFSADLQGLSLVDHLIKPVQRLPKYELLLKDLKKNTEESHPDYGNITKALEKFVMLNNENNRKMESYLRQLRLFELQKVLIPQNVNLFDRHRQFISEESLFIIKEDSPSPISLHILSDSLVLLEEVEGKISLLQMLLLDQTSFVCDLHNTRTYKWLLSVYGKDSGVILMTDSKEHKLEIIEKIQKVIAELSNKNYDFFSRMSTRSLMEVKKTNIKLSLRLKTIGTFKRGIRGFKPYTVYVIECTILNKKFRLYIRFSELIELEQIAKQCLPELKLPHFPKTLSNFFNSQKLKIIETRKLMIESFLQSILQNCDVSISAKEILIVLGLPLDFYQRDFSEGSAVSLGCIEGLYEDLANRFYKDTILMKDKNKEKDEVAFDLIVKLMDKTEISLKITRSMRVIEICKEIARMIHMISWLDFKLFLVNPVKKEEVLLDDEEFLIKAMEFVQEKGIMDRIFQNFEKVKKLVLKSEYVLVFKKQGYFRHEAENKEFERDEKRFHLVFLQFFAEVIDGKYSLSLMDYCFLACIRLYTIFHRHRENFKFTSSVLAQILPAAIAKNIEKESKKASELSRMWKDLSQEIDFLTHDLKKTEEERKGIQINTAKKLFFAFIDKNLLFGSELFWVSVIKKEKNPAICKEPDFFWLLIKNSAVCLLHPSERKRVLKKMKISEIEDYVIYPNCVKILGKNEKLRVESNRAFEIGELLHKYLDFFKNKEKPEKT